MPENDPSASNERLIPALVRALYRVLLLREPDPAGLDTYVNDIRNRMAIEEVMRGILVSAEFSGNRAEFWRTYGSDAPIARPSSDPFTKIEFEYVTHSYDGRPVTFALDKAAKDTFTEGLRQRPPPEHFIRFILRRAKLKGGTLKVADFGANVGVISLPLAAHGLRLLAIEALPANFLALATAARINGLPNFLPVNMAALDRTGLVSFSGTSAWATAGIAGGDVTVSCDTLVNILQVYRFSDVDIIKIDIEGAELPALSGAQEFFIDRPDAEIIFESNNHTCHLFDYDRQDLLRWFENGGFSLYVFGADGLMPIRSDDVQPVPVVDILATKRRVDSLTQQGETIVAMNDDYILRELLAISTSRHPHIRQHFVTEATRVGNRVKNSPLWPAIVRAVEAQ